MSAIVTNCAQKRSQYADGGALCRSVFERSEGIAILAFSRGKDACGAWLQLRRHGFDVRPFFRYLVPGLEFEEESLTDFERFFGCRIARVPHPSLYRLLNNAVFTPPDYRLDALDAMSLPRLDYERQVQLLRRDWGLSDSVLCAQGVRATDSPTRMMAVKKYGPLNEKKRTFWPIYDWNKARLKEELTSARIQLPADYSLWGRSFDGIDYRFLAPLKEKFPRDYNRVLKFFPLAEVELLRRERRERYHASAGA